MSPKRVRQISQQAQKTYDYLLQAKKASKENIMKEAGLASLDDYIMARNELLTKGMALPIKGRQGGLALIQLPEQTKPSGQKLTAAELEAKLSTKARTLWNLIPRNGDWITNLGLRYKLRPKGLSASDFWKYREELLSKDMVEIGRGQGGRIRRADSLVKEISGKTLKEEAAETVADENELYRFVEDWLKQNEKPRLEQEALKQNASAAVFVKDTSSMRNIGKWSNPDLMMVSIVNFDVLKKKDWTIYTYEIKKYDKNKMRDPANVFEAASHQKGAHYSYLVFETTERDKDDSPPEEISDILDRFGVGFAWFFKLESGGYYMNVMKEAELRVPAIAEVNKYLMAFAETLAPQERGTFKAAF